MRKANKADKAVVTGLLSRSFADNLSFQFMTGDGPEKVKKLQALMGYAFEVCTSFWEVLLSEDSKACALLVYPEKKKTNLRSLMLDLDLIWNCVGLKNVFKVMKREAAVHALHEAGHKVYVWFIGVDPAHQRKGIGSKVLLEVIKSAELQERDLILETSTLKNIPWYKDFGFQTYATVDLGYKLFFMRRLAN